MKKYITAYVFGLVLVAIIGVAIVKNANTAPKKEVRGDYYIACGCGCCPWEKPTEVCVYHSKNQSLLEIEKQDIMKRQSDSCKYSSCQNPIKYIYCD